MPAIETIEQRLTEIKVRISELAPKREVDLVVVTKKIDDALVKALHTQLGISLFAENHGPQLQSRKRLLPDCQWDFLGHLSRKVAHEVVSASRRVVSVRSKRELRYVSEAAAAVGKQQQVLLQLELTNLPGRRGLSPQQTEQILENPRSQTEIVGLMTMNVEGHDPRPAFHRCAEIREELELKGYSLPVLSMGMSSDYEIGLEEGSTEIRLGRVLFADSDQL